MQKYGISERQTNPAELFEDFHRRMGLRNKISNALMAVALFEAKSGSRNLTKYITDGLSISGDCVTILDDIAQSHSNYQYRDYTSKVLLDILTDRLSQNPAKDKLETYKKGFAAAREVFEAMQMRRELDEDKVRMVEQVVKEVDKEIESTYASEENLYRGSFVPR